MLLEIQSRSNDYSLFFFVSVDLRWWEVGREMKELLREN